MRFEHSVDDSRALQRGFAGLYWVLAVVLAAAGILRRELLLVALVFAVVVAVWQWRTGRVALHPWALTVDESAITVEQGGTRRVVRRGDVERVRFVRRHTRGASWWELQALGSQGRRPIFRDGVRDDHRDGIEAALRERGWPVR